LRVTLLPLFTAMVATGSTLADQPPSVPINVVSVTTLGSWRNDTLSGSYRVITTREGWEHLWSRVFVDWQAEPASRDAATKTVAIAELIPPLTRGYAVLQAKARVRRSGGIEVVILATMNDARTPAKRYVFTATAPDVVLRAPAAKLK
jgi:hypothetical protein